MLPSEEEDLFAVIQKMPRRVMCDSNLPLPDPMSAEAAFILGQTFDHEGDFWLRKQVRRGNENVFTFGVVNYLQCFPCLEIRRLRKEVVASMNKRKANIPAPEEHYSPASRWEEIELIVEHYLSERERLLDEICDLRPFCVGAYEPSYLVARRCAALLLQEEIRELQPKIMEEWQKIFENHPNVLGDTLLIQNALYFNAEVLTKDKGAQAMAGYCDLKWTHT